MVHRLLLAILLAAAILLGPTWVTYHGHGWPFGTDGLGTLIALVLVVAILIVLWRVSPKPASEMERSERAGLVIGLLWTAEIGMNNLLTPALPLRDRLDDGFWALITLLIVGLSASLTYRSRRFTAGVASGLWMGLGSGAVACLTALVFVVFGMSFLVHDPLNVAEWATQGTASHETSIQVYFAYQTLAGAMLHLIVLGVLMGGTLGVVGGGIGVGVAALRSGTHS